MNSKNNRRDRKPIIMIFTGYYVPGYKAGGILRNVINTIDNLFEEFDFLVVSRDRDLGDDKPYKDVVSNKWSKVGNASVFYLSPEAGSLNNVYKLIKDTHHDILFLTSYFESLTIKVLFNRWIHGGEFRPVVVAPFGEFAWASLGQKFIKKFIFIKASRLLGLYKSVTWRVSSQYEANDLINVIGVAPGSIHVTGDLPIKNSSGVTSCPDLKVSWDSKGLNVLFLSRISREKNLDYALRVLCQVKSKVNFDIYGPTENASYWKECQGLIAKLPSNIIVRYLGSVSPHQVLSIIEQYDLLFLPTGGEAYGNVIAESLSVGTPVLISTHTPWRNLRDDDLGWDIDLKDERAFIDVINEYASFNYDHQVKQRTKVRENAARRLLDPQILETNRQLFLKLLEN